MAGAKKGSAKKDSGKKEAETVGHVTKKGGVHHKGGSTKKGDQADVSGHIVARSAKKDSHKRGDDPSVHAK